jgi:hypothetical protein
MAKPLRRASWTGSAASWGIKVFITILICLYTLALCGVYGTFFFKSASLPLSAVAGLAILTALAQFLSLFVQIGLFAQLLILAGAIGILLARRLQLRGCLSPVAVLPLLVLIVALLVVLENATHRAVNPDTNLYHAQAIRWIETYPAVPGLGNLHGRLAYNSAWMVANALFSFAFLGGQSFHLMNAVLFLLAVLVFWQGFVDLWAGRFAVSSVLKALFLPLAFYLLGTEVSSPGTDLPVSLLLWMVAVLWTERVEDEKPYHTPLIVLLAAFALTVKLSAAPVALLAAAALGSEWLAGHKRRFFEIAACGLAIVLPFLARNVILSGYLVYPFPALDLFSVDWKIAFERASSDQATVIAFGRRLTEETVATTPFSAWFPRWLSIQTINRRAILFLALLTPLVALAARFKPGKVWTGWLGMYMGVLYWLFSAPDFRFGYGFLVAALGLALAPVLVALLKRMPLSPKLVSSGIHLLTLGFLLLTLAASFEARTFARRWLLPADYDRVSTRPCPETSEIVIFCSQTVNEYSACSYFDFPCVPFIRSYIEMRGETWREGFRPVGE